MISRKTEGYYRLFCLWLSAAIHFTRGEVKRIPGVPGLQNIPLLIHCHMGINFCGGNGTVPQHFLDIAYIYFLF